MSEITNEQQLTAQGEELDDFDVEGHGLKEIALGLSAATIVAGGAGATALAMDNPLPGTTSGARTTVTGVQDDVRDQRAWAERVATGALDRTGEQVGSTVREADRLTTWAGTTVTTTTTPVIEDANQAVAETTDLAEQAVADPVGSTDRAVDNAMKAARDTRDGAVVTAKDTATRTERTVATTVTTAGETAADAAELATSTAGEVHETVDPQASVQMDEEGATVQAGAAGKTVTVSTG